MEAYAAACRQEVVGAGLPPASSVFFGGGTPSLLPTELLVSILDAIRRQPGAEVTIECNPENVTAERLAAYRAAGANRLSFGVQSMVPHVLTGLGRVHDVAAVRRAVGAAGTAGFGTFNVDLIYGGAGESDDDWARSLDEVLGLDPSPPHVSAYALTVEPGTPLAADPGRHPDDDQQADRYLAADRRLSAAGLAWYEISNWAVPGHECRHNQLYWRRQEYRGIGAAAHSYQGGRRWWNVRTPDRYIRLLAEGRSTVAGEEWLDADTARREGLLLALRTRDGVPADALPPDPDLDGLIWRRDDRVGLTPRGRLLANAVAIRLQ
jgi:putative oxygen-independent coproporphyrinogen III oxidase